MSSIFVYYNYYQFEKTVIVVMYMYIYMYKLFLPSFLLLLKHLLTICWLIHELLSYSLLFLSTSLCWSTIKSFPRHVFAIQSTQRLPRTVPYPSRCASVSSCRFPHRVCPVNSNGCSCHHNDYTAKNSRFS